MRERHFMMSMRFDKKYPADFGLIPSVNNDVYFLPSDNSIWEKRDLYDFGWGKENGYYNLPLPQFDDLINIIINSECNDDRYGAAAILLDDYGDKLLIKCQDILKDEQNVNMYCGFFNLLQLDFPLNRSSILGKSLREISKDFEHWKDISKQVRKHCNRR